MFHDMGLTPTLRAYPNILSGFSREFQAAAA
jgi:hypothetical protein